MVPISMNYDGDDCFCGMVDQQKVFSLISSPEHCQRSLPSQISHMPHAGFEFEQNLSSGFIEWSYAVVITTTPQHHKQLKTIEMSEAWWAIYTLIPIWTHVQNSPAAAEAPSLKISSHELSLK